MGTNFEAAVERSSGVHGCLRIDRYSETRLAKWRCRLAAWPFVSGTGCGHTLEQACERAVRRFDAEMATREFATIEDLRNI